MLKKCFALISLMLLVVSLPAYAASGSSPDSEVEGVLRTINRVDHNNHYLIVDDIKYLMPLNFKVYAKDRITGKNRRVNRYALKEGLSVFIGVSSFSRKPYVNVLIIEPQ
jgi:hypothetical protein